MAFRVRSSRSPPSTAVRQSRSAPIWQSSPTAAMSATSPAAASSPRSPPKSSPIMREGRDRVLRFGKGSPYLDIRFPCGGGVDLLIHVAPKRGARGGGPRADRTPRGLLHRLRRGKLQRRHRRSNRDGLARRRLRPPLPAAHKTPAGRPRPRFRGSRPRRCRLRDGAEPRDPRRNLRARSRRSQRPGRAAEDPGPALGPPDRSLDRDRPPLSRARVGERDPRPRRRRRTASMSAPSAA